MSRFLVTFFGVFCISTANYAKPLKRSPKNQDRYLAKNHSRKKTRKVASHGPRPLKRVNRRRVGNLHSAQDGHIRPYRALISADGSFAVSKKTVKSEYGSGDPINKKELDISFNYLWNLGKYFAGPVIGYSSATTDFGGKSNTSNEMDVGAMGLVPLGDLNREKMVPYVYGGARFNTELEAENNASGYRIAGGAGIFYFLESNIALSPAAELQYQKLSVGEGVESNSTNMFLTIGVNAFVD